MVTSAPGALDVGGAEGDGVFLVGHGALRAVEQGVLDKYNGVVPFDCGLEHTAGVVGSGRGDDLEAGDVGVPILQVLGVRRRELTPAAGDGPDR